MQIAAGKTLEEINAYLSQFDVWDRYDFDGDGDFDEPDGYIDTFQSVHAGLAEEEGGGILGDPYSGDKFYYSGMGDDLDNRPHQPLNNLQPQQPELRLRHHRFVGQ